MIARFLEEGVMFSSLSDYVSGVKKICRDAGINDNIVSTQDVLKPKYENPREKSVSFAATYPDGTTKQSWFCKTDPETGNAIIVLASVTVKDLGGSLAGSGTFFAYPKIVRIVIFKNDGYFMKVSGSLAKKEANGHTIIEALKNGKENTRILRKIMKDLSVMDFESLWKVNIDNFVLLGGYNK